MSRFYFFLWLRWAVKLSFNTMVYTFLISLVITFFMYAKLGFISLDSDVFEALLEIHMFSFKIIFSLVLLFFLFRSIKYIFNTCIDGYEIKLLSCDGKEVIEYIGYGDLLRVWRKWFMLLIWLVATCMILTLFSFFNIYALFIFILLSGYLSFIILISKCKKVSLRRC